MSAPSTATITTIGGAHVLTIPATNATRVTLPGRVSWAQIRRILAEYDWVLLRWAASCSSDVITIELGALGDRQDETAADVRESLTSGSPLRSVIKRQVWEN